MVLSSVIQEVVDTSDSISIPHDIVIEELKNNNTSFILALYMLGFSSYNGF